MLACLYATRILLYCGSSLVAEPACDCLARSAPEYVLSDTPPASGHQYPQHSRQPARRPSSPMNPPRKPAFSRRVQAAHPCRNTPRLVSQNARSYPQTKAAQGAAFVCRRWACCHASIMNLQLGIPYDLPYMPIGILKITGVATPECLFGRLYDSSAGALRLRHDGINFRFR